MTMAQYSKRITSFYLQALIAIFYFPVFMLEESQKNSVATVMEGQR